MAVAGRRHWIFAIPLVAREHQTLLHELRTAKSPRQHRLVSQHSHRAHDTQHFLTILIPNTCSVTPASALPGVLSHLSQSNHFRPRAHVDPRQTFTSDFSTALLCVITSAPPSAPAGFGTHDAAPPETLPTAALLASMSTASSSVSAAPFLHPVQDPLPPRLLRPSPQPFLPHCRLRDNP